MKRTISIVFFLCTIIASTFGQLTIEDIWKHYTYYPFGISKVFHSNTGTSMYIVESNKVLQIPYSKQKITTILDANGRIPHEIYSIQFSPSEDIMLAATNIEMIRRNSYSAQYYVYHISTDSLHLLLSDSIRIQNPTFSPANNTICYFYNNNLYITNGIDSPHAITNDGAYNKIINGMPDWVSEEEFDIQQAFAWSPQGMHIAYIQWDESTVPEYTIPKYGSTYPELFTYKYPKAGEEPAQVRAKIYSVQTQKTSTIQFPCTYTYIPEFSWIDSNRIAFTLLNRLQNKVEIAVYSLLDNSCKIVYTYTSKTYVDIPTYFTHIEGTNSFIICNDSDGYNNLYIFTYESGFAKKITQNLGDITDVYGYFKESNTIMFQATNNNPLERYVFELNLQTGVLHCLSDEPGTHTLDVNSLGTGWIREYSNKNPMVVSR